MSRGSREKRSDRREYHAYPVKKIFTNECLVTVRCHIFYEQRMMDIPDGTPKWSGMDQSSQLLNDRGIPLSSHEARRDDV